MSNAYIIVHTTFDSRDEAERVAGLVVEQRLAACAQIESIQSIYHWDGKIENNPEFRIVFKTRGELYDLLEEMIVDEHPYDVPEIIALPILGGSGDYIDWIDESTREQSS
jgi:periplasmic divalent cation tolerance protein